MAGLRILLIKPSKYDDDGYVVHHFKGVLPSNTLNCLNALSREAERRLGLPIEVHCFDETVQLITPERILRRYHRPGKTTLVALVGVQTNQFPRAADLARRFRRAGVQTILGGFHPSGSLALLGMTPELQALMDDGVSIFAGEAEGRWESVLQDVLNGELKPLYAQPKDLPDLSQPWPMPQVDRRLARRFITTTGTLDTSRGCIWKCSFCTIINVQGNSMRSRDAGQIIEQIRQNYTRGIRHYFLTDDNLARNAAWEQIFDGLARLRAQGCDIDFMMQVDVPAFKIRGFVEKAAAAGCTTAFIGVESLNPAILAEAGKGQNKTGLYEDMVAAWRKAGIVVHASYIIGFAQDSVESVRADMRRLRALGPDIASFFMLTPLPGSKDHLELFKRGEWMDKDFNKYDSFHAVAHHPQMSDSEWFALYQEVWRDFYSTENLKAILARAHPRVYWGALKTALWYAYAALCEGAHPMITGFWRLKGRTERRSTFPIETRMAYTHRRMRDSVILASQMVRLFFMFADIWQATWVRPRVNQQIGSLDHRTAAVRHRAAAAHYQAKSRVHEVLRVGVALLGRVSLRSSHIRLVASWQRFMEHLRHGRLWHPGLYWEGISLPLATLREVWATGLFVAHFVLEPVDQ